MLSFGPLRAASSGPADATTTAVLLHGIGLGPWMWDPWLPMFHAANVRTVALELPGHGPEAAGDTDLRGAAELVVQAVRTLSGPVVLVGHSMGALLAMIAAASLELTGVVLLCPLLPGPVRRLPPTEALREAPRLIRRYVFGQPLVIRPKTYRKLGFSELDDASAEAAMARLVPWPPRLARSLINPPRVEAGSIPAPMAVFIGKKDRLVRWQDARVLGDLHEAVVWRYDSVGHTPPLEPNGARVGNDLVGWVIAPSRPKIIEFEAFGPNEGVGTDVRTQRRGDARKKRSAYGQKESARKS